MGNLKKEKYNEKLIFILIAILILAFILNIYLFISLSRIIETRELYASIIVSDKIGFDLNLTALTFGEVIRGGSSEREVNIENNFGFPIEVDIYGKGDIKKFIIPFKDKIEKDKKKNIVISASAPLNADFGEYFGEVVIKIKKI
ncbi:MAG: hypothetical protein Q8N63_07845 [Nanoarchaeota archaeon]|nr:hypothetical protein [Nanoarchaeota archaeon]